MKKLLIFLPAIYLALTAPAFASVSTSSPKAFWNFDERSGYTAYDTSGYGTNLQGTNNLNWTNGLIKSAVSLNGVNSYLMNSHATNLDLSGSFSFVAWINSDILPQQNSTMASSTPIFNSPKYFSLLTKGMLGKRGFEINFKNNFLNVTKLDQNEDINGTSAFQNSLWQQVAVTWDSGSKVLSFYKDGLLTDTVPVSLPIIAPAKEDRLVVGASLSGGDRLFSGYLDQMRVYDRVISPSEIRKLYSDEAPGLSRNNILSQMAAVFETKISDLLRIFGIIK